MSYKTCFIATGPLEWASARLRAWWVAPYMDNAICVDVNQVMQAGQIPTAENYIFGKIVPLAILKAVKEMGAKCWWDFCDPLWWWSPDAVRETAEQMDGLVFGTEALRDDFELWMPDQNTHVIHDRLELARFDRRREHRDVDPVRFIWYGVAANRVALAGAWPNLVRLSHEFPIELTIMDDRPDIPLGYGYEIPLIYVKWQLDREVEIICRHDIALLPPYPGPWGEVKSNNKALTAYACGLVPVDGFDYETLRDLVANPGQRWPMLGKDVLETYHHVSESAAEWEALL